VEEVTSQGNAGSPSCYSAGNSAGPRGPLEEPGKLPEPVNHVLKFKQERIRALVVLEWQSFMATIDTGATRSCISESRSLELNCGNNWRRVRTRVRLADGSRRDLTQALMADIQLGQNQVRMPLRGAPTVLDDLLLGVDFLCGIKTPLSCGGNHLQLRSATDTALSQPVYKRGTAHRTRRARQSLLVQPEQTVNQRGTARQTRSAR